MSSRDFTIPGGPADIRSSSNSEWANSEWPIWHGLLAVTFAAIIAGAGVGIGGIGGAAAAAGIPLAAVIFIKPQFGAYMWLLLTPLIVGMERGDILPFVRPNEALLVLALGAAGVRVVPAMLIGQWSFRPLGRIDLALLLLVLAGSVTPLFLRFGRGLEIWSEDVLYSFVLVKYLLLYLLFRFTIHTEAQVRVCLYLVVAASLPVALIALLQVNNLLGVPQILEAYYGGPFAGSVGPVTERGTSTVASSFGVANIMSMTVSLIIAWFLTYGRPRLLLLISGIVCLFGVVAAGQFSGFIGIGIMILMTGFYMRRLGQITLTAVPVLALAVAALWPVVEGRLSGFERQSGLPQSWDGRIENMQVFILPELTRAQNWLLGVRPAPQIPAPEWWRDWVFIESGYIWLLWIGGIPFLVAFLTFVWVGLRELGSIARNRRDAIGISAVASASALTMIAILMALDPHLTMRGGADLFYPLLALSLVTTSDTKSIGGCHDLQN